MIKSSLERYETPVCESFSCASEAVFCETSFGGGTILPGMEDDWGDL